MSVELVATIYLGSIGQAYWGYIAIVKGNFFWANKKFTRFVKHVGWL